MSKLHQIISCHAVAISLFVVAVTAFAEPSSSLTLRFGPAFQSLESESVQFMTSEMGVTPDPVTGLLILGPILTPIPGDWYEGSLRFHSATPAFAFLAAVPEPSVLALSVIGLFFLVLISRRSLGTH